MSTAKSMNSEIVRIFTKDGIELHGLLFMPASGTPTRGVVHVHGLAGNFYENRFIFAIAEELVRAGLAFFTFNNRGHDYISDLNKETPSGVESIRGGGAFERVSECVQDIDAAITLMQERGVPTLFLEGHSTGANKVVFYQAHRQNPLVKGLVLLSPCDDVALQHDSVKERAPDLLASARTLIDQGKGEELMPTGSYYSYPMSAATFYDYFGPEADQDVFPYRDPGNEFKALGLIAVPMLVTFGKKSDGLLIPAEDACQMLERHARLSSVTCKLIEGASHSYLGQEAALAQQVLSWLEHR